MLTEEQITQVVKLKDLAQVLTDFVTVIEESQDPKEIGEAVRAIDYYQRFYFNQVLTTSK